MDKADRKRFAELLDENGRLRAALVAAGVHPNTVEALARGEALLKDVPNYWAVTAGQVRDALRGNGEGPW